jgi:hypothetical protein
MYFRPALMIECHAESLSDNSANEVGHSDMVLASTVGVYGNYLGHGCSEVALYRQFLSVASPCVFSY